MAIISFTKTVDEFLSGKKTETRRDWSDKQLEMWISFWNTGRLIHDGWNKLPRAGGKSIGEFILTQIPFRQQLKDMTKQNLIAEGGMCDTIEEFCKFINMLPEDWVTVIRFRKM